jgi:ArsR family transcriptional regulator, arsenate/arsenite/antimonite-responsive transcriptional repressor
MNEMLDYVKAMSDPIRLRIIGLLTQESATRKEIAERLNLSPKDSLTHLGFLEFVGAVMQTDGVYTLNKDKLAVLGKEKLADLHPSYTPPETLDEKSRKVLKSVLDAQGHIKQIPLLPAKLRPLLEYLIPNFEFDRDYTEREVNEVLRRFNEDTASLRRHLVDAGLLAREDNGSRYWRVKEGDA